ncbi:MAG: adenylosuccinate synthase [Chitinophagales bacterium]|nr:adenylosuccinate synthase [Chitinophagales bacterium]
MSVDVLIGLQWGDEGKGKIVDYLAPNYDIIARFQGGPNAGHTLVVNKEKIVLHTIPSGILHDNTYNLIGNGVVINPITLCQEMVKVKSWGVNIQKYLMIAEKAHLILPTHKVLDAASEAAKGKAKIGSTLRGIGPTYMDKTGRNGLRIGDILTSDFKSKYQKLKEKHLEIIRMYDFDFDIEEEEKAWFESIEELKNYSIVAGEYYVNNALANGKRILAEGAQGSMLDIDFGTYPFVTSSNTITAGACNGLGVAPNKIKEVIGISKAYCTRVGSGPFPTELDDEVGEEIRKAGFEFGATTGRPRRCGWIDLVALRYACFLNGVTQIALTKADVLNDFASIEACTSYNVQGKKSMELPFELQEKMDCNYTSFPGWQSDLLGSNYGDLPVNLQNYVSFLEDYLKVPVSMVSTGPEREKLLLKQEAIV